MWKTCAMLLFGRTFFFHFFFYSSSNVLHIIRLHKILFNFFSSVFCTRLILHFECHFQFISISISLFSYLLSSNITQYIFRFVYYHSYANISWYPCLTVCSVSLIRNVSPSHTHTLSPSFSLSFFQLQRNCGEQI